MHDDVRDVLENDERFKNVLGVRGVTVYLDWAARISYSDCLRSRSRC